MSTAARPASSQSTRLPWPFEAAFLPIWLIGVAWSWWSETLLQLRAIPDGVLGADPARMTPLLLLGRAAALLGEAGVYALWWRSRGAPLPYWRFACWIASLSTVDVFSSALRRMAGDATDTARFASALFAGPMVLSTSPVFTSGAAAAFGNLGLLTLLRVTMTAWAAARGAGRPLAVALRVTVTAWLITRLAAWWSFDLIKGASPIR